MLYTRLTQGLFTNLHGSVHVGAVKHEVEVVQVAANRLPGHVFHLFVEEFGHSQRESYVHHLCPENITYYWSTCFQNESGIIWSWGWEGIFTPCKMKGIRNDLSTTDDRNILHGEIRTKVNGCTGELK